MTTNVYDGAGGLLAADTRWSTQVPGYFIYIDEPLCPKIALLETKTGKYAFLFAGFGGQIQVWKDWIRSSPTNLKDRPDPNGMVACVVNRETKDMVSFGKGGITDVEARRYVAGSGASYAYSCLSQNGCAKRAVMTASQMDKATGGTIHFFDFANQTFNFVPPVGQRELSVIEVSQLLSTEGMVMKTSSAAALGLPFKIKDVVANDPELKEIQGQLASGTLTPDAPCDSMFNKWSSAEVDALDKELSKIFGF